MKKCLDLIVCAMLLMLMCAGWFLLGMACADGRARAKAHRVPAPQVIPVMCDCCVCPECRCK